ncbi:long-chain fatty acid--CoA ligase [uncultured Albimonas sp.]|uniref:AMP-dependent synthetase/ligase n=1 Tax=uncultured Albimonas sp. TaxID=1331701 RepID=UPI0030EF9D54|tara:strand:- start:5240 stop:7078 length:1839 start_codon:yes stop_codon:yes gene_type:complete
MLDCDAKPVLIDGQDTLAKLFRDRVGRWGDRVAFREKDFGVWRAYTWKDYDRHARQVAAGLMALGLRRGDVVAILSEDNKEWVFVDMGAHLAGCVVNGVYPTYQAQQLRHLLVDSDARVLVVEDEEQLDKVLEIREHLPNLLRVYVIDWKGLRGFHDPLVEPIDHLYEAGEHFRQARPEALDAAIDAGANADIAVLIYTSGTTGAPKGALISHRYLLHSATMAPDPLPLGPEDELLTYLPLCHAAERMFSLGSCLAHGTRLNFAESSETVIANLRELSPTVVFAVPRIWEKFYSRVRTLMSEATWLGRIGYDWAFAVGTRRADHQLAGRKVPASLELRYRLADVLVFRNIKELLGLDRAHFLLSGAAPISPDLLKWFMALGLRISEGYGQTECGTATMSRADRPNPGSVGFPLPGVEVKLGEADEILVRGPNLFSGYHNNPEATAKTVVDGWLHTGDVGAWMEDGSLRIRDRLKDIIITAGGKNVTPSLLENALKFSPYIADAIIVGDRRKYLSCLIMIDQENVEHHAQAHAIPFTDYKSLCARPEVVELIAQEVEAANRGFSPVEQVKTFRLINILLTAEDDEMTPTMKLKRSFVEKKYAALVDQMYREPA